MDSHIDHYDILGLPSGEEGSKLSEKEISKAYRSKALELHPDKRPDDPNAHINFQKLKTSYEILKDEKARKLFDDLLRVKQEKSKRQSHQDAKRQKMMSDLDARERSAFRTDDDATRAREDEERIAKKLKEEIARIRAMHAHKTSTLVKERVSGGNAQATSKGAVSVDKEKVLKVSWDKVGVVDYTAQRLRELFGKFGEVEDVVIRSSKRKGSALVVMASKDAVELVCGVVLGDLSNPLLVVPLATIKPSAAPVVEDKLVGAGYQAFEDSVLEKLRKAAERQKS
ncbi:unnamed protein product [Cuscuta epithymum]|uniref:J domain-containing protein n=1 Tax=Cuscuta epithymum TaxID=186058 RepID=A0AAV0EAS3_9ASTE|nr:unnamed protein product [Cuscuta epithymum]CAH9121066.1 unnamed protein product [Cuscuta epithymum]